ncbi:carboxypeptidase-like regulatory domain-containing protein [Treponema primitia]|uniref:carboxypeptidase-like regulatory domain-containing protein n=1 Tax=Treponema primitia TaxID=88058 RepID=UPI0011D1BDA3|nr:carboxypeptidase-like regulatory domain-containing protein [Treponema primitia]
MVPEEDPYQEIDLNAEAGLQGKATVRANISGVVVEAGTFKPIKGALVTLGGSSKITGDNGEYEFSSVVPNEAGTAGSTQYWLHVTAKGYRTTQPVQIANINPKEYTAADPQGILDNLNEFFGVLESLGLPTPKGGAGDSWTYTPTGDGIVYADGTQIAWDEAFGSYVKTLNAGYTFGIGQTYTALIPDEKINITGNLKVVFRTQANAAYTLAEALVPNNSAPIRKDAVITLTYVDADALDPIGGAGTVTNTVQAQIIVDEETKESTGKFIFKDVPVSAGFDYTSITVSYISQKKGTGADAETYLFGGPTSPDTPWTFVHGNTAVELSDYLDTYDGLITDIDLGDIFLYASSTGVGLTVTQNGEVAAPIAKRGAIKLAFDKAIITNDFEIAAIVDPTTPNDSPNSTSTSVAGAGAAVFDYKWTDTKTVEITPKLGYIWPYSIDGSKPVVTFTITRGHAVDGTDIRNAVVAPGTLEQTISYPVYTFQRITLESITEITSVIAPGSRFAYRVDQGKGLKLHFSKAISTAPAQVAVQVGSTNVDYTISGNDLNVYIDREFSVASNLEYTVRSYLDPYDDWIDNPTPVDTIVTNNAPVLQHITQYIGGSQITLPPDTTYRFIDPRANKQIILTFDVPLTSGSAKLTYKNQLTAPLATVSDDGRRLIITYDHPLVFDTAAAGAAGYQLTYTATANGITIAPVTLNLDTTIGSLVPSIGDVTEDFFAGAYTVSSGTITASTGTTETMTVNLNGVLAATFGAFEKDLVTWYRSTAYGDGTFRVADSGPFTVVKGITTGSVINTVQPVATINDIGAAGPDGSHGNAEGDIVIIAFPRDDGYVQILRATSVGNTTNFTY